MRGAIIFFMFVSIVLSVEAIGGGAEVRGGSDKIK